MGEAALARLGSLGARPQRPDVLLFSLTVVNRFRRATSSRGAYHGADVALAVMPV